MHGLICTRTPAAVIKRAAIVARIEEEFGEVQDEDRICAASQSMRWSGHRHQPPGRQGRSAEARRLRQVREPEATTGRCPARSTRYLSTRPRVEGVHMRFGKVARGGIRPWSTGHRTSAPKLSGGEGGAGQDAVIVPVGARVTSVPQLCRRARREHDREAEGVDVQAVHRPPLDITDSRSWTVQSIPPATWACTRANDPYLVVAGREGTGTFLEHRQRDFVEDDHRPAMPSHPAAQPVTTIRPWALPHAVPGRL